jgi:hypothetical protein
VSLATDSATEAIYPLLPFFLTRVLGAGAVSLGVLEEPRKPSTASEDRLRAAGGSFDTRKRPLVLFWLRHLVDRAVRSSPSRCDLDAGVHRPGARPRRQRRCAGRRATRCSPSGRRQRTRGKVYGFHRSMDSHRAVVGPALASVFLWFYPEHYRTLFALTISSGAIAVALIFLVPKRVGFKARWRSQMSCRRYRDLDAAAGGIHRVHARP